MVNVSGHRLGTMEVESALVAHEAVAEAAVVGRPDDITGQAIEAFVSLEGKHEASDEVAEELRKHVAKEIGSFAKPAKIRFADALPKTRSGKIMRRLLRDIASGKETVGDTTTLEDLSVLAKLRGGRGVDRKCPEVTKSSRWQAESPPYAEASEGVPSAFPRT